MPSPLPAWHHIVTSNDASQLEALFTEDAVFLSPALHKPQQGRDLVCKYLRAAIAVLNGASFRYTNEWQSERSAVLEFALVLDGLEVNGVDMIHWNEAGLIDEFKVMVRPMKALGVVVAHMAKALG